MPVFIYVFELEICWKNMPFFVHTSEVLLEFLRKTCKDGVGVSGRWCRPVGYLATDRGCASAIWLKRRPKSPQNGEYRGRRSRGDEGARERGTDERNGAKSASTIEGRRGLTKVARVTLTKRKAWNRGKFKQEERRSEERALKNTY
jgi:hypothetical protein